MRRVPYIICLVFVVGVLCGCGGSSVAPSRISGRVTYKGAPVPAGGIAFHSEDKGVYPCALSPDGSYSITDVPVGKMVVTIDTEFLNPAKKVKDYGGKGAAGYAERLAAEKAAGIQAGEKSSGTYMKIPEKYSTPKTSPLIVTIESGKQTREFELTD